MLVWLASDSLTVSSPGLFSVTSTSPEFESWLLLLLARLPFPAGKCSISLILPLAPIFSQYFQTVHVFNWCLRFWLAVLLKMVCQGSDNLSSFQILCSFQEEWQFPCIPFPSKDLSIPLSSLSLAFSSMHFDMAKAQVVSCGEFVSTLTHSLPVVKVSVSSSGFSESFSVASCSLSVNFDSVQSQLPVVAHQKNLSQQHLCSMFGFLCSHIHLGKMTKRKTTQNLECLWCPFPLLNQRYTWLDRVDHGFSILDTKSLPLRLLWTLILVHTWMHATS